MGLVVDKALGALSLSESLTHLQIEFHQTGAGLRQIPAWPHHSHTAGLAQRLVAKVDVQQGLHRVILITAENIVGPQASEKDRRTKI